MWSPDQSIIITAEKRAAEEAAAARKAMFPNLEPDKFWFIVRLTNHEQDLHAWVDTLDPQTRAYASSKLDFAKFYERDNEFVEMARIALSLSSEELDTLWSYAL